MNKSVEENPSDTALTQVAVGRGGVRRRLVGVQVLGEWPRSEPVNVLLDVVGCARSYRAAHPHFFALSSSAVYRTWLPHQSNRVRPSAATVAQWVLAYKPICVKKLLFFLNDLHHYEGVIYWVANFSFNHAIACVIAWCRCETLFFSIGSRSANVRCMGGKKKIGS